MNNKKKLARFLVATLLLAGCAATSIQFNYKPETVTLADAGAPAGQALVLGQAYMRGYGDWVQLIITAVDTTRTHNPLQLRPNINLLVPPGKRTLTVLVLLGNSAEWRETQENPKVSGDLQDGIAYQVKGREVTDIRGKRGVDLWIERLGTIAEYQAFLKAHPGYKQGQPITQADLTTS